jgi:iron complex outermembrane receptor protein
MPTSTPVLWGESIAAVGALEAGGALPPGTAALLASLPVPTNDQIGITALTVNLSPDPDAPPFLPTAGGLASVQDVPGLKPTIWNTAEVGYKGLLGNKFLLALNGYYSWVKDFVSALRPITPNVFLNGQDYAAYLVGFGVPADQAAALAGVVAQLPLGSVAPTEAGGAGFSPIIFTYQNLGDFNFFGADLSFSYLFTENWELGGSAAWVEDNIFSTDVEDVPLNAPKWKGALTLRYRSPEIGLSAAGRGRFVDGFPVASGVYVGEVAGYSVFDLNVGYTFPGRTGLTLQLDIQNLFDDGYQSFVGSPELGRYSVLRLVWNFGS